jgi:hypothetical protein
MMNLHRVLRGHYAYYGLAGNLRALLKVYSATERYWFKVLNRRNREHSLRWASFARLKERHPLLRPRLGLPYAKFQRLAVLPVT